MRISNKGLNLVKEFEGCYLKSYQDAVGVWTIGYGITTADKSITGHSITKGMTIAQATADKWLEESLNKLYLPKVMKYDHIYHFNSSQMDALISFAYNIGSIDQLTANGTRSIETIKAKMLEYNKAGGKVLAGLTRRRKAELELFNFGKKTYDGGFPTLPPRGYFQLADRSDEVKKVQKFLDWVGFYNGSIDGIYGPATEQAVKDFQRITKISSINGKFGNKCLPLARAYKK